MYGTGILYELDSSSRTSAGDDIAIRLIGASVSIDIVGSEQEPASLADMATIAPDDAPFTSAGWLSFGVLPRYIAFVGTADDVEASSCILNARGAIS